ncbi:MAG: NADP-dependent isocitrate dehydrogenase [Rhodospirillales bacterium]|nr:NADP-dependent isocitrate dehydrogenase [Rhodospirillales bacterium]MCB9964760.1 NADP-dependent isocitrate dehydrogenase [Rhodospirillales bacterium]MCB9973760.1 NADP-dependent isocitrate dehydrogenase [Rhodospirillales bacterium]MCB9980660.1 NADP-dependent isocitrate dehydrogenase [Rhodospirillales bacterium]
MTQKTPVTVARGDGIGPEIMDATLKILEAGGARLEIEEIEIGEKVYERGVKNGIEDSSWASLRRTKVFLKAPIFTPMGKGYKSLNVTVRKTLGLYANVRPCTSYYPFIETNHEKMDVVIVRENEEDLYAGIEYRQTQTVCESMKLISRPGSEKIIRYAFEYARANARKKVTCMIKDNIMKMADGLFYSVFQEIGAEYPEIEQERYIIDIGTARIAAKPQDFDVIVTENLYGDIISDVAAEITGSVGLGISANIGQTCAMFEAMHGTAPDIAGKGIANPSGLLLGSIMMLVHIGQNDVAERVHNAWLKTIEDGIHTGDIYREGVSKKRVGTDEFTQAVVARMGQEPVRLSPVRYGEGKAGGLQLPPLKEIKPQKKELVGCDVYLDWMGDPDKLGDMASKMGTGNFTLEMISNRGMKVWPDGAKETFCGDHWRLRYKAKGTLTQHHILDLIDQISAQKLDVIKIENLYTFDGENGFTQAQGE